MEAVIKNNHKKHRWQALAILLIPALVMGLAWFIYFTGIGIPDGRTNKGTLISPPTAFDELQLHNGSEKINLAALEGNWGVIVFGSSACDQATCQESLYKTRQVHIALGKESDRLVRLYVAPKAPALPDELVTEHPKVFWLNSTKAQIVKALNLKEWPENQYFIVDPLGNIMMQYFPEQEGGDLLKDLRKLMKASKIG